MTYSSAGPAPSSPSNDGTQKTSAEDQDDEREDYAMAMAPVAPPRRGDEQTVYVIEFETEADGKGEGHRSRGGKDLSDGTHRVLIKIGTQILPITPIILLCCERGISSDAIRRNIARCGLYCELCGWVLTI